MGQKCRQRTNHMDRKHVYSSIVSLFCREILPSKRNFNRVYFGSGTSSNPKILPVGYLNNYLQYAKNEIIPEKKRFSLHEYIN